jgi:hypothetical protein
MVALCEVILHGMGGATCEFDNAHPVVLQFFEDKTFESAEWQIPSFSDPIPTEYLSEIRVTQGPLTVYVDGPDGFQSGPHPAMWVRSNYPSGKDCAFLMMADGKMSGVTILVDDGIMIVDELRLGGPPAGGNSGA